MQKDDAMNHAGADVPSTTLLGTLFLHVSAGVRYWEDATVNGKEDYDGKMIPFRNGECWCPVIDLETGLVVGWPSGMVADIHYKVCDAGEYWLSDSNGTRKWKYAGDYVPDRFLCHGDRGYGDYIIFSVDATGLIVGYSKPIIEAKDWDALPNPTENRTGHLVDGTVPPVVQIQNQED